MRALPWLFVRFQTMQASSLVFNLDTQWRCCRFARWQCRNGKTFHNMQHAIRQRRKHTTISFSLKVKRNACDDVDAPKMNWKSARKQKGWNWNFLGCNWAIHHRQQQHERSSFFVNAWCLTFEWYSSILPKESKLHTCRDRGERNRLQRRSHLELYRISMLYVTHFKTLQIRCVSSTMFEYQFHFLQSSLAACRI